jgi:hypothetical protein
MLCFNWGSGQLVYFVCVMKQIMLFIFLALSISVFAQIKKPSLIQINDSIYRWRWDTLGPGWTLSSKTVDIVYDPQKNLTGSVDLTWNGNDWENFGQYLATYDAGNNLTSEINKSWSGSAWENTWRYTHTYNSANKVTIDSGLMWNGSGWENSWLYTYTYDAANNLIADTGRIWTGSGWDNLSNYSYFYDGSNNLTGNIGQTWTGTAWENAWKFTFTYDAANNQTGYVNQMWNSNDWENFTQCTYTYDAGNNRTSGHIMSWENGSWHNSWQFTDFYDSMNNLTNEVGHSWNGAEWVISWRSNYTYDIYNLTKSDSYIQFDITGTQITGGDSTRYYIDKAVGITKVTPHAEEISIYPNPCTGTFSITSSVPINDIKIYTATGTLVYSDDTINPETFAGINLSSFGKGVYMIRLYHGTTTYTRKIVIKF